jgi:hypothetical protein
MIRLGCQEEVHVFKDMRNVEYEVTICGLWDSWKNNFGVDKNRMIILKLILGGSTGDVKKNTLARKIFGDQFINFFWGNKKTHGRRIYDEIFEEIDDKDAPLANTIRYGGKKVQETLPEPKPFSAKRILNVLEVREKIMGNEIFKEIDENVKDHGRYNKKYGLTHKGKLDRCRQEETDCYYKVKALTPEMIELPIAEVLDSDYIDYVTELCDTIKKYIKNNPKNDAPSEGLTITKTGFTAKQLEIPITEYEYSIKSALNALTAIFTRQTACRISPDPKHLKKFQSMCKRFWLHFFKHF